MNKKVVSALPTNFTFRLETETEIYSNCQDNELLSPSMDSGPSAILAQFKDCLQVFLDAVASLILKCVTKTQAFFIPIG